MGGVANAFPDVRYGIRPLLDEAKFVDRHCDIALVVEALGSAGCFPSILDTGEYQGGQGRDDGDHNKEFDQREAPPRRAADVTSALHVKSPSGTESRQGWLIGCVI